MSLPFASLYLSVYLFSYLHRFKISLGFSLGCLSACRFLYPSLWFPDQGQVALSMPPELTTRPRDMWMPGWRYATHTVSRIYSHAGTVDLFAVLFADICRFCVQVVASRQDSVSNRLKQSQSRAGDGR